MHQDLSKELRVAGQQYLKQFDYPQMPKIFHQKLETEANELARMNFLFPRLFSIRDAYDEIYRFVVSEYSKIYQTDY